MKYRIPEHNLNFIEDKIARFNAKITKWGGREIEFRFINRDYGPILRALAGEGTGVITSYVWIDINEPETIQANGWHFVARLERAADDSQEQVLIHHLNGGGELPERFRDGAHVHDCDHCNLTRRRNGTWVVRHDDGRYAQVGSNCLEEFLGSNVDRLLRAHQVTRDLHRLAGAVQEGQHWEHGQVVPHYGTGVVIEIALREARELRNAELGQRFYWTVCNVVQTHKNILVGVGPEAIAARNWLLNDLAHHPDLSDYDHNAVVAAGFDAVDSRMIRHLVHGIRLYLEAHKPDPPDPIVGDEAKGTAVTAEVESILLRSFNGRYGWSQINKFITDEGRIFAWYTTSRDVVQEGEKVTITGRVKSHGDYKGEPHTVLTRVAVQ